MRRREIRVLQPTGFIRRTHSDPPAGPRTEDEVLYWLPEAEVEVTESPYIPGLFLNAEKRISRADYLDILRERRKKIADGLPFDAWDSVQVGNKDFSCSWGICSNDPTLFPKPRHHTWPLSYIEENRSAHIGIPNKCPLDPRPDRGQPKKLDDDDDLSELQGCFWKCRIFQGREGRQVEKSPLTREEVLALYDAKIELVESMIDVPYEERKLDGYWSERLSVEEAGELNLKEKL
jgi:hypothetical protein